MKQQHSKSFQTENLIQVTQNSEMEQPLRSVIHIEERGVTYDKSVPIYTPPRTS